MVGNQFPIQWHNQKKQKQTNGERKNNQTTVYVCVCVFITKKKGKGKMRMLSDLQLYTVPATSYIPFITVSYFIHGDQIIARGHALFLVYRFDQPELGNILPICCLDWKCSSDGLAI